MAGLGGLGGFHHAALSVRDVDASSRWYCDVFGFEETLRQESDPRRVVVMRFPGRRDTLGLVEHKDVGEGFRPQNLGLDHLAFAVESGGEFWAWPGRLDERGVTHSGAVETPFGGMLHFKDPDGIALALFWERT